MVSRRDVLVCSGTACQSTRSLELKRSLEAAVAEHGLEDVVRIVETGCMGPCALGPMIRVLPEDTLYVRLRPEDVDSVVRDHLAHGKNVPSLLWNEEPPRTADLPFFSRQQKNVLSRSGVIDPCQIDGYLEHGGYEALARALKEMTPEQIILEIEQAGLRGRGGAGFPTGRKWGFVRASSGESKYVVCNADEGDPGAFMDRAILEGDPHSLIEGMVIAAYAVGAKTGYIYARAEYPLAIKRLRIALDQARDRGFLGEGIAGTPFSFDAEVRIGAGAFVCGEETALIASIEGQRGVPRPRPPFPAQSGVWGKPTLINNVETFANVRSIIQGGAKAYAAIGTEGSKGTKVFALAGQVCNTGLVEVPMGITFRELIFEIGGGILDGGTFKAVQTGGPSGGCLPESLLDVPIDYESLTEHGAIMGSGGVIVLDQTSCMVDVARYFLDFTSSESCGKCVPCRVGIPTMLDILTRITHGEGTNEDIPRLKELAKLVKSTALCGLGQTAPNPVLSTLRYFEDEYRSHIEHGFCPAGVCEALVNGYDIDPDLCRACDLCRKACPVDAVRGTPGSPPYSIDAAVCIRCGACHEACPFDAVHRLPRGGDTA
ncbi:MAG: NADH-quinone oxidoreductase subunit NuoF [Acidimicrobiia bacterium]|nr:NADH-quinone oxidoreductase subunit NuoF [Acidimicrobiia bacterium]